MSDDRLFQLNLRRMSGSRRDLLDRFAGREPTREDNVLLSRFVAALRATLENRKRTEIRGLGVFTWRKFKAHLPNGRTVNTVRLWFHSEHLDKKAVKR